MNLANSNGVYRFENVEIDLSRVSLRCNGQEQYLRQQAFQVLLYLIEQRHRLVGKEELIEKIWHSVAVTDNTVGQCIFDIRRTLGDDSRQPRFIKTIPKTGYRWLVPVERYPSPPIEDPARRPLAVLLSFTDLSGPGGDKGESEGKDSWLTAALCAWLSHELSKGKNIQVAPTAKVAQVQSELGSADLKNLSPGDLVKLRESLGADVAGATVAVVTGSYTRCGGYIHLIVHIRDTRERGAIDTIVESAPESDLFHLVARVRDRLSEKLRGATLYRTLGAI